MEEKFEADKHDHADKSFCISGPTSDKGGLILHVDYDDVNHDLVDEEVAKLIRILNEHW